MCIIKKYTLRHITLQYEIQSPLPLNITNEFHNTAQNCTTKCTTCSTIKFIEKLNFLCVLVLLNRQKIKFTSSIKYSSYQQRDSTNLVNINCFTKDATYYCALFVALSVALFVALFVALSVYTFYLKFCCISL